MTNCSDHYLSVMFLETITSTQQLNRNTESVRSFSHSEELSPQVMSDSTASLFPQLLLSAWRLTFSFVVESFLAMRLMTRPKSASLQSTHSSPESLTADSTPANGTPKLNPPTAPAAPFTSNSSAARRLLDGWKQFHMCVNTTGL